MEKLHKIRLEIDKIDEKITKLLLKRAQKVLKIKDIKKSKKLPITDQNREKEILQKFSTPYERDIFKTIIRASKQLQNSKIQKF